MRWQKRARLAIAIFGIAFAIIVYAAIGERAAGTPPAAPARIDPNAILESEGAQVQQERGSERDFDITAERSLTYEDGTVKMVGPRISVRGRQGRDFVLTGGEAQAGQNQQDLQLAGAVKLAASDGFVVTTESASFSQRDGMVRAPGAVQFEKGRMSGSGVGMTYDQAKDLLSLIEQAQVKTTDESGATQMEFTAGSAVLDRPHDSLTLDGSVHALRDEQVIDGDHVAAKLTANDDAIVFIELRGNSRVAGGSGTLDSMSARDIDLDYTDDGKTLERVVLTGRAALAMSGQNGAGGRQMMGETLDIVLAPDGSVTRATGRENVQLDFPASDGVAARTVKARLLDGVGEPDKGLTAARFTGDVQYQEQGQRGAAGRVARSDALEVTLENDTIGGAIFTGQVTFNEEGLEASGAETRYEPEAGRLRISGADAGGPPRVADEQITIEAQKSIDVTLEGRSMTAVGPVKTTLRSGQARGGRGRGTSPANGPGGSPAARGAGASTPATAVSRLPGLLNNDEPANVSADALEYEGGAGKAVYTGSASLWQGQTAIRANIITIDQDSGDLVAEGAARSTLVFDTGASIGSATEIRYTDAKRVISYLMHIPAPVSGRGAAPASPAPAAPAGPAPAAPAAPASPARPAPAVVPVQARLSGPQGDLRADRLEVILAQAGNRVDRLEAYTNVYARVDVRVATGGRLTYYAEDERYVLVGASPVPVKVIDNCRETMGKTLTFFKTADRIIVDGNEEIRTQTKRGGPCAAVPAR